MVDVLKGCTLVRSCREFLGKITNGCMVPPKTSPYFHPPKKIVRSLEQFRNEIWSPKSNISLIVSTCKKWDTLESKFRILVIINPCFYRPEKH